MVATTHWKAAIMDIDHSGADFITNLSMRYRVAYQRRMIETREYGALHGPWFRREVWQIVLGDLAMLIAFDVAYGDRPNPDDVRAFQLIIKRMGDLARQARGYTS